MPTSGFTTSAACASTRFRRAGSVRRRCTTWNRKEAHRIDLISTTPYVIVTDAADNALDVRFPKLREGKVYEVAVSDYVYRNYKDLNYTDGKLTGTAVAGVLLEELQDDGPLTPDNRPRQKIIRNS